MWKKNDRGSEATDENTTWRTEVVICMPSNHGKDTHTKAVCGSYRTAALWHIVLLPERVPSFISRGIAHTKRRERPLLAKEGTISGSFKCRKAGT
jgi:hypothetical protein